MTTKNSSRYGIYFAPSTDSPLYQYGNTWLGRDVTEGKCLDPALPGEITHENWLVATESPRRYGFHATLKPPFRLSEGVIFEDLRRALYDFCANRSAFDMSALQVSKLGYFLALTPTVPSTELNKLAEDCVSELDRFRAVPSDVELAGRLNGSLSEREREHVLRWGYPYVFDTWKFHMTLTSSLQPHMLQIYLPYLQGRFAPVCERPVRIDSVCIFHEPYPGASFLLIERVPLRRKYEYSCCE